MIAHTWPQCLKPSDGWQTGILDEAAVTRLGTGATISRSYQARPKATYQGDIALLASGTSYLEEYEAFLRHTRMRLTPCFFLEPDLKAHRNLYAGVGDGATKVFPLWTRPYTASQLVYVDGALQATGVAVRTTANYLTDDQANCVAGITGTEFYGGGALWVARWEWDALDGIQCFSVTRLLELGVIGIRQTDAAAPAATASRVYSGRASVKGASANTFAVNLVWYTVGNALISRDSGTPVAGVDGEWVDVTIASKTAPATTAKVKLEVEILEATGSFFAACLAVCPGSLTDWYLPSVAPVVAEFTAAPDAGAIITSTIPGTGTYAASAQRLTRCRLAKTTAARKLSSPGHSRASSVELVEDWAP